jgi:hypothetical protein
MDTTPFLRNRLAVAVGTLLLLLSVFGTWQALRAQMQTHRAVERETEISRLLDELDRNSGRPPRARNNAQAVTPRRAAPNNTEPAAPAADAPQSAAATDAAVLEQVRVRLIQVAAKAKTAEEMFDDLRQSARRQGYSLHPNTTEAYNGMQAAMEEARRDLDLGRARAAREQIDIAEALAKRVLKAGGQ